MESLPLGERIRAARLERKMTQDELARDTFSKSYVSAVELGKIHPSIKALRILARRLQLPASHFLESLEPDIETQQAQLALARARLLVTIGGRDQEAFDLLSGLDHDRLSEQESAEAIYLEGRVLIGLDRANEALIKLQQAQLAWEEIENFTWVERVRNLVGELYLRQHKYMLALEQHKQGRDAIQKGLVRDPNLKLTIYANLARVYSALDMHDAARGLSEEASTSADEAATPEALFKTLWNIAAEYEAEKNYSAARNSVLQACSALDSAETSRLVTHLHLVFGSVYLAGHNWKEAEKSFLTALETASPPLPAAARIAAYNSLANLYLRQQRLDEALNAADKAYHTLQQEDGSISMSNSFSVDGTFANTQLASGEVLLTLARISEMKGNREEADRYFEEAINQLKQGGQPEQLSAAYFSYGEILLERGDSVRGAHYLKIAYEEKSRVV
ncbi:MAG TPA: helix-turn-helix domain-containing protein [Chloroflexia bacterium]|nr:helix-turn-helix domain-containing protein [Chloroflexia bacterium]